MSFAIIETGSKQYKVAPGQIIKIEKLKGEPGSSYIFSKVLLFYNDKETRIGSPYVDGVAVQGEILRHGREKRKIVFRYHSKTRYRKKKTHRQPFTEVKIMAIES
jgi:large subunit ribosomal protein L21